ncbi:hypothetical protein THAOC_05375, partial [Thalassiosira oceanica]
LAQLEGVRVIVPRRERRPEPGPGGLAASALPPRADQEVGVAAGPREGGCVQGRRGPSNEEPRLVQFRGRQVCFDDSRLLRANAIVVPSCPISPLAPFRTFLSTLQGPTTVAPETTPVAAGAFPSASTGRTPSRPQEAEERQQDQEAHDAAARVGYSGGGAQGKEEGDQADPAGEGYDSRAPSRAPGPRAGLFGEGEVEARILQVRLQG